MQFHQNELRAVWSLRNFPPIHWLDPIARNAILETQDNLNARQSNFEAIEIENAGDLYCHPPKMSSVVKGML